MPLYSGRLTPATHNLSPRLDERLILRVSLDVRFNKGTERNHFQPFPFGELQPRLREFLRDALAPKSLRHFGVQKGDGIRVAPVLKDRNIRPRSDAELLGSRIVFDRNLVRQKSSPDHRAEWVSGAGPDRWCTTNSKARLQLWSRSELFCAA